MTIENPDAYLLNRLQPPGSPGLRNSAPLGLLVFGSPRGFTRAEELRPIGAIGLGGPGVSPRAEELRPLGLLGLGGPGVSPRAEELRPVGAIGLGGPDRTYSRAVSLTERAGAMVETMPWIAWSRFVYTLQA